MKMKLLWVLLTVAFSAQAATDPSASAPTVLSPLPQESIAAPLAAEFLSHRHYKPMPLDEAMSQKIFDRYLKSLDPERMFFTQIDIDKFAVFKNKLAEGISSGNANNAFAIFNRYEQVKTERFIYARSLLKQGFDFTQKESFEFDREKEPWAKSEDEVRDLWRKRVKNDWLRLKLAGNDNKSIAATLEKRYNNYLSSTSKMKSEDVFQIFMDSYAMSIDPHTNYMGPRASEDFDISMKLSLTGIGAVLEERDEYTTIRELVAGYPAALSGKLKVGDRIVGVAQGEKAPMVDVLGWRLDDTVALIRGAEDSTVVLDIIPEDVGPDGKHKLISLVRKKITLPDQSAKDSIMEVKEGNVTHRIGVITLPIFYRDFSAAKDHEKDVKSATHDVAALLAQLKKDKVDSILIDLRNNGGGALVEAIDLTGLFIRKGPVVQERDASGHVSVGNSSNDAPVWSGPLGVLINRGSASASEIFAAAIQDYGRGLIIGEQSFGKGTVQQIIPLDKEDEKPKYGELKMTIAQFFRINGGTTQLRGVTPDISFPLSANSEEYGESTYDNALPWVQIKPADYALAGDLTGLIQPLQAHHELRMKNDKEFQYRAEDIAEAKALRKKNWISLNEVERRKERETTEARIKSREKKTSGDKQVAVKEDTRPDDGLQASERKLTDELAAEKARKDAKDIILTEAAHVLSDEIDLLKTGTGLAKAGTGFTASPK